MNHYLWIFLAMCGVCYLAHDMYKLVEKLIDWWECE